MNVDLELYRVFYVVAKHKHMTKASEELHISQPAISQSIKKLEEQLGGTLFLRSNKGMELTEEGKMFYEYVKGALELIKSSGIEITGKNAVVVGRSNNVGKPMALLLLNEGATVTVCHSKTQNLNEICKNADVLVAAVGKANLIGKDAVKEGAVVIDVGINRLDDGSICGDVDYDAIFEKASYITPVPGGVGPMTIAMLLNNVVKAAKLKLN